MMRLECNSKASTSGMPPPGPGAVGGGGAVAPGSPLSQSFSSDFMGNQLASYFSQLFEKSPTESGGQRKEKKKCKKCKKSSSKTKEKRKVDSLPEFYPSLSQVSIPRNPSPFAVFAAVRATCLENRRRQTALLQLQSASTWKESDDGETNDMSSDDESDKKHSLPKIVGIGLQGVFEIIRECKTAYPGVCLRAMSSLLDILQGHQPEELGREPTATIESMFDILMELATSSESSEISNASSSEDGRTIRALSGACLLSLAVAYGDTGKLLSATSAMLMSLRSSEKIIMPAILTSLQRSVTSVMIGRTDHPDFMGTGITNTAIVDSFSVQFRCGQPEAIHCISSNGPHLFLQTSKGLFKVGTGYAGTIKGHIYRHNPHFHPRPGWLGFASGIMYFFPFGSGKKHYRNSEGNVELAQVDVESLSISHTMIIRESAIRRRESPHVLFSDGTHVAIVTTSSTSDNFVARFYSTTNDVDSSNMYTPMTCVNELPLKLARKGIEVIGTPLFDDSSNGVTGPSNSPAKSKCQVEFGSDDEMITMQSGKDFTLILTNQGRVYFTGKSSSIGHKHISQNGQWHEMNVSKSLKVVQFGVGHDAQHALLLGDDGSVYFVGTAKRGEDGDQSKARRQLKSVKPKKFSRMEGLHVVHVAAGNGTSALVTKEGDLYVFGKDSSATDFATGLVTELKGNFVSQVAVGKAHIVVLTKEGDIFTFGMNNKGQCGRDFPPPKVDNEQQQVNIGASLFGPLNSAIAVEGGEDIGSDPDVDVEQERRVLTDAMCLMGKHKWKHDQCMVCAFCGECTGYGASCVTSGRPDRNPGTLCGCGSGDSGCADCGCCRSCSGEDEQMVVSGAGECPSVRDILLAQEINRAADYREKFIRRRLQRMGSCRRGRRLAEREKREGRREDELVHLKMMHDGRTRKSIVSFIASKGGANLAAPPAPTSDPEKDVGGKLASLPPAKILLPRRVKITQLSAGLHHTLLLSSEGEVFGFGSNTHGQLGQMDLIPRGSPTQILIPNRVVQVAAGAYHSVVLTIDGEVFTFGNHQKGQLGRCEPSDSQIEEISSAMHEMAARRELWFAIPGQIPNLGSKFGRCATWIGASGEQTFLKVDESLINAQSLVSSTVTANGRHILLIPTTTPAATFKALTISRSDGFCRNFSGTDHVSFTNNVVTLDSVYNVLWAYDNSSSVLKSYNPIMSGIPQTAEFLVRSENSWDRMTKPTILSPELALPLTPGCLVSHGQASLNLLSCLDTLSQLPESNLMSNEEDSTKAITQKSHTKEDYSAVNRFESHGGGWGYSGHSVEAIRFMVDSDILLGGFGLFGGRGEYAGKIKLFDIGIDGGDQERDGDLLAESDEFSYECGVRQKYPILFDEPVPLQAGRWYVAWARVSGPSSDCGSSGQSMVVSEEQIQFHFKSSKKSNNGTDVNAGQIPQLLYRIIANESQASHRKVREPQEPVCILSNKFARRVTPECFRAPLALVQWAWNAFKAGLRELREDVVGVVGDSDDDDKRRPEVLDLQRLVYICRACLRLVVTFTEEVYPNRINSGTKPVQETQKLAECVFDVRTLLQQILTDPIPPGLGLTCQKMVRLVLADAHRAFVNCFHAFYPTGFLKWACLCNLLASMEAPGTSKGYEGLLTAVLDSLCNPLIKLRNTFPITYSPDADTRCKNLSPTENLSVTTSMIQAGDTTSNRYPILTELMNYRSHHEGIRFGSWSFREVLDRLLSITSLPVRQALKGEPVTHSSELVEKACQVISSVIAELSNQTLASEADIQHLGGRALHSTPNRFTRTSNSRTWNTGNGSPDAICFSVDRPGIFIVGCCVYGGVGNYDYELELLDDQSIGNNDKDPTGQSQRWNSLEIAHGSYTLDDCVGDIAELKFEKPVAIRPHTKYGLRLRNHGGRTSNGDGGTSTVKGPDGTTFTFTSCSLSFNGTNPTRGQIPQILYFSTPQDNGGADVQTGTKSLAEMYARCTALTMTSSIVKTVTALLVRARDAVDERGLEVLNSAPIITKLMPNILASILSLAVIDPASAVQVVTLIQEMLPSVACLNNLVMLRESEDGSESSDDEIELPVQHYAWVESDHPYKPAAVMNYRVVFPTSVRWMSLEFDPRCSTAQQEDVLQIFIKNSTKVNGQPSSISSKAPIILSSGEMDIPAQKYRSVLKKFSGATNWPQQSVILPGNEILFSLETASYYVKDSKQQGNNFGFRCLVVGYENEMKHHDGLKSLEMELAYLGGTCAAALMTKTIQLTIPSGEEPEDEMDFVEESAAEAYEMHSTLLSKGFALERPPSVNQALEGSIPFSSNTNERNFLRNFVLCTPNTSGGRLARWLQPESYVDVDRCQVLFSFDEMRCSWPTIITVVTHDQYDDVVHVQNLRVEVRALPVEEMNPLGNRLKKMMEHDAMTFGGHKPPNLETKYEVSVKDKLFYHAITLQKAYDNYSFEELRYASPAVQRQSENMLVRPNNDGTYTANWTPGNVGWYQIHVTIDNISMADTFKVEVKDPPQGVAPPHPGGTGSKKSCHDRGVNRLRKFVARPSAGLRIRIHPTLQSEQIGIVPVDGTVSIIEELQNSDGAWARLSQESLLKYVSAQCTEGWCMQYNQHLDKTLLVPVSEPKPACKGNPDDTLPSAGAMQGFQPEPSLRSLGAAKLVHVPVTSAKRKFVKEPGLFTVVKTGASGHNIRSFPSMTASPIGILNLGDIVMVSQVKEINGEIWVRLDQEAAERHCFVNDGDAWSIALTRNDIKYLESEADREEQRLSAAAGPGIGLGIMNGLALDSLMQTQTIPLPYDPQLTAKVTKPVKPESAKLVAEITKPTPPPRHSLIGVQHRSREGSPSSSSSSHGQAEAGGTPKRVTSPGFFQKWFKGDQGRRSSPPAQSPPSLRKVVPQHTNKDLPPELQGVSVKELVKVIGESRANGNGVTPPGTPGTQRRIASGRSASPQMSSSRSSSPSHTPAAPPSPQIGGMSSLNVNRQSLGSKSSVSDVPCLTRQDSSQSDTSAVVSSLTRDASPAGSRRDESTSPISLRSDPLRSVDSPTRPKDPNLKTVGMQISSSTQTSPDSSKDSTIVKQEKDDQGPSDPNSISRQNLDSQIKSFRAKRRRLLASVAKAKRFIDDTKSKVSTKEAMSPSVAESVRSVFAAFVWHEGIVHDAMAVASYLKFHPNITKHGNVDNEELLSDTKETTLPNFEDRARQRHSAEVFSSVHLSNYRSNTAINAMKGLKQAGNASTVEKSSQNANTNRNIASNRASSDILPESVVLHLSQSMKQMKESGLPTTVGYLVLLWEEIRSYCIHAILQQVIVASPLHGTTSSGSTSATRKSDSKRDRERKMKKSRTRGNEDGDAWSPLSSNPPQAPVLLAGAEIDQKAARELEDIVQMCELCNQYCLPPVTFHMRAVHPGCGGPANGLGYNSGGHYCGGWAGNCGDGGNGVSSWYLMCEVCREVYVRKGKKSDEEASPVRKGASQSIFRQHLYTYLTSQAERRGRNSKPATSPLSSSTAASSNGAPLNSHNIMNNNALFLLELASSSNSDLVSQSHLTQPARRQSQQMYSSNLSAVSELASLDPNPFPLVPFQCFQALGIRNSHLKLLNAELSLDDAFKTSDTQNSIIREGSEITDLSPPGQFKSLWDAEEGSISEEPDDDPKKEKKVFSRSVSVGGADVGNSQKSSHSSTDSKNRKRNSSYEQSMGDDGKDGHGDFHSRPSPALEKLFSGNGIADILQRPVMGFVLQWNDLDSLQTAMTLALRKAACRTYAMRALNWLLRSVSQPACLHDLLWCFVAALESNSDDGSNSENDLKTNSAKDKKSKKKPETTVSPRDPTSLFEHPMSDITIAGEAAQPLPDTFHNLLQTISDLMLMLPIGSSLQQIAITCWGIKFRPADHHFLHRSHVFSTISKILSRSEELENAALTNVTTTGSFCDSQGSVEKFIDISSFMEIKVSSRSAMLASLQDNSTETFWESGDEDRNKTKWMTVSLLPHHRESEGQTTYLKSVGVHIDNCRDMANKVSLVTYKSGTSLDDLRTVKQCDVESRFAGWVSCFIEDPKHTCVKIEVKGPDNSLRLRQFKAIGLKKAEGKGDAEEPVDDEGSRLKFTEPSSIQQRNCETETLRVFRLITGQVFGRLLDDGGNDDSSEDQSLIPTNSNPKSKQESAWDQEPYLKEHVVGILFSRSKLTHLQKQVCAHIVQAIKKEASKMRDDWEVSLCSGGPGLPATEDPSSVPDTYCFEMLSLVLALSGSSVGRSYLASQFSLILDLLTLLHTGSARIQRQVISLLRRVLPEVAPINFANAMGITSLPPKDFSTLTTASEGADGDFDYQKPGIIDVFLSCIAKALNLQVKTKTNKDVLSTSGNNVAASAKNISQVSLASTIHPCGDTGSRWWMRGSIPKKISEDIIKLLKDMTLGKVGEDWANITKSAIAENILNLTKIEEKIREPQLCLKCPVMWLALASLCVLDKDHVEGLSSGEWTRTGAGENAAPRPTCENHDDGETPAIVICDGCGNLCADCDRFLHLHRRTKHHQRQVFKEEEDAIKVDLHEGCGRIKLFWIMALADSMTLKALVEFRDGNRNKAALEAVPVASAFSVCRFCGRQAGVETAVLDGVCSDRECADLCRIACQKVLQCGHYCGGIADETDCLPCLHGCSGAQLRQDADDMCMVCFTEALSPIPSLQLACGHIFHYVCVSTVLEKRWTGPRIAFGFRNCPICKAKIEHQALRKLLDPIDTLYEDVKRKALMRLEYEGLSKCEAVTTKGLRFYNDPAGFSMERYAYYVCFKCKKAYFGGEVQCDADAGVGDDYNPEELVCGGCSDVSRAQMCPKHGTDYLEYKCRYCCSVAVFFCFGTTHFCNACHDDFQRVANVPKQELPQCPVGPKAVQLAGDECPLHVNHPPTGEEFALGCGICRNAHTF